MEGRVVVRVRRRSGVALACAVAAAGLGFGVGTVPRAEAANQVLYSDAGWLEVVNFYRTESGLDPVTEDSALTAGALKHSQYIVGNQTLVHDETDGGPYWTPEGDKAGNASNVAASGGTTPDRQFIELFMTAPYHALGILRPGVERVGYARADDTSKPSIKSAASLDIISALSPRATVTPILFPGDGSTVPLDRFVAEHPDPRNSCGWAGQTVGLPLIAMLPEAATNANATLTGPSGSIEVCVLSAANTSGEERALLAGDNAVLIIPRNPLATGQYRATVSTSSRQVAWTFGVDPSLRNAQRPPLSTTSPTAPASRFTPLAPARILDTRVGLGGTRLTPDQPLRVQVTGQGGVPSTAVAVAINITAVGSSGAGYLTTYPCSSGIPDVSTVNFATGQVVPNSAVVPLDANGGFCVVSPVGVDVLVDVSGALLPGGGGAGYRPLTPARIVDTRGDQPIAAGATLRLQARGAGGISSSATAVALNVTAVDPAGVGYVTVHPCLATAPTVSNLNLAAGKNRPNLVIVPLSNDGEVCFTVAETSTHLLVDVAGEFSPTVATTYTPLAPIRLADTRSSDSRLNIGSGGRQMAASGNSAVKAAGTRGAPGAVAAMVNVTVVDPSGAGYLTVHPCGPSLPETSTVNYDGQPGASANASIALLDMDDDLCTWSYRSAHVIVDLVGVWS